MNRVSRWMCSGLAVGVVSGVAGCDEGDVAGSVIGTLLSVYDIVSLWV